MVPSARVLRAAAEKRGLRPGARIPQRYRRESVLLAEWDGAGLRENSVVRAGGEACGSQVFNATQATLGANIGVIEGGREDVASAGVVLAAAYEAVRTVATDVEVTAEGAG